MSEEHLRAFICKVFLNGDEEFPLDSETRLLEDGICDSLGLVQIVSEIERRCPGIRIHDQDVTRENFGTIASILRFVNDASSRAT